MAQVVALLRSINVGGRRLKMDHLRAIAADAGCTGVSTLVATGNIVMDEPADLAATGASLQAELARQYGETAVVMRTHDDLVDAVAANPLAAAVEAGELAGNRVHTMFLFAAPSSAAVQRGHDEQPDGHEQFEVVGAHLLGLYPDGMARTTLTASWLKRRLGTGTMHNHNTVQKVVAATTPSD